MNYPMYNNSQYYMQNLQDMRDRIDNQIRNYQQTQMQQQQQPSINQTFQLAPTQNNNNELESRYVENVDDVKNTFVIKTGIFVNKDFSKLWIKNVNGDIRTFNTQEIVEIDPKDKEINALKSQIEELKGMISYANERTNANVDGEIATEKSKTVSRSKSTNAK